MCYNGGVVCSSTLWKPLCVVLFSSLVVLLVCIREFALLNNFMIIRFLPVFIVGLPTVNVMDITLNKLNYITPHADCQTENQQNTLEYNYIKQDEYIKQNIQKYDTLIR